MAKEAKKETKKEVKVISKSDIIEAIAATGELPSKAAAKRVVDKVFSVMTDNLTNGHSIQIAGFGTIAVCERAARSGINPQTKKKVKYPAHKAVRFRAGKALKDAVNS